MPGLEYSRGEDSDMDMGEEMGGEMGEGMGEAVDMWTWIASAILAWKRRRKGKANKKRKEISSL